MGRWRIERESYIARAGEGQHRVHINAKNIRRFLWYDPFFFRDRPSSLLPFLDIYTFRIQYPIGLCQFSSIQFISVRASRTTVSFPSSLATSPSKSSLPRLAMKQARQNSPSPTHFRFFGLSLHFSHNSLIHLPFVGDLPHNRTLLSLTYCPLTLVPYDNPYMNSFRHTCRASSSQSNHPVSVARSE